MSEADMEMILARLESWFHDADGLPGPDALAQWQQDFQAAFRLADRGSGWSDLVERAHRLGAEAEARAAALAVQRDHIRQELELQGHGGRALKGYGTVVR